MSRVFIHYLSNIKNINSIYLTSRSIKKDSYKYYNKKESNSSLGKEKKILNVIYLLMPPLWE